MTFDYRGFGRSHGTPSENGLCLDAISVVKWAIIEAGISLSRIIIFGQSLGTAVSLAVLEHFALQSPPVVFAGAILVAPFIDVATLVATYRVAGSIPILSPLAKFPLLFNYLTTFLKDGWSSKDRIANNEANRVKYQLTLIHAEDDFDIPSHHTEVLFWHAVNATRFLGMTREEFEDQRSKLKKDLGAAGSVIEYRTEYGVIREEVLKTGLHDVIMGNPVITIAVMCMFQAAEPSFR